MKNDLDFRKNNIRNEEKILTTLEQKTALLLGGYSKKMNLLQKMLEDTYFEIDQKNIEKEVFAKLSEQVIK